MPLPRTLVYNDLSGDEIKHILQERFAALLGEVPYLQKHITLPRVRMVLDLTLETWADQPTPEKRDIQDYIEIRNESLDSSSDPIETNLRAVVDASPHGDPPDKVRDDHGLGIPTPTRGRVAIEDTVEGKRVTMPNGAVVDRTGTSQKARSDATVVEQDFGPARAGRSNQNYGNQHRSGPVVAPDFSALKKDK